MSDLSKDELTKLVEHQNGQIVSIFLPTEKKGADVQQNPIRLKNLVAEAESQLNERGARKKEINQLLQPVRELVDDFDFWQDQQHGLAVYRSTDMLRFYHSPVNFEEMVVISKRPYLKPLIPLISMDGRFYVLALSQNEVKLWRGSVDGLRELHVDDMPASLEEALWYEYPQKQQQFHTSTSTPAGRGDRAAMFHGHGVGQDDNRDVLVRYFQKIDRSLQPVLHEETSPMVVAGVDFLHPIYQEINTYPHLAEKGIFGNPEAMKPGQLHQQAMAVLQPAFEKNQQEAKEEYRQLVHTEQAAADVRTIVPAAYYGRVKTLFVAVGHQQWGRFDPDTDTLELEAESKPDNEDLLDAAAIQTFLKDGDVYVVDSADMPADAPMAAVFRY